MVDRVAIQQTFLIIDINDNLSVDIEENEEIDASDRLPYAFINQFVGGYYNEFRTSFNDLWGIVGQRSRSHFDDFYFRIHVNPILINLETVASSQTREVLVWNAWPYTPAQLEEILVSNPIGIEIDGQATPYTMQPLKELTYDVTIGVAGPPNIDIEIQFNFSNVPNPIPILVLGNRAVKFDIVPEVPVSETWEWLTDRIVSVDGTEQRIALRGEVPRVEETLKVIFDSETKLRKFYADIMAASGRLWIPEFQYATKTLTTSPATTFQLYFDVAQTDIRAGEYVLVQTPLNSALIEIEALNVSGATVTAELLFEIPKGSLIMPGSPALINNNAALSRYAVNTIGETTLVAKMIRQRATLERPGSAVSLPEFLGQPVMDKRPLANDLVTDAVSTGQETIDNATGLQDIITRWNYSRIGGEREFKVNRIKQPEELDYWKAFLAYARGAARKFWMPTYRPDLHVVVTPVDAASSYTIEGVEYAEKMFSIETHRYIEIETASGIHRATITGCSVSVSSTVIAFTPSMPTGAGYIDVKRISYLLPVRLAVDKVIWQHYGLESLLQLSIISAEA